VWCFHHTWLLKTKQKTSQTNERESCSVFPARCPSPPGLCPTNTDAPSHAPTPLLKQESVSASPAPTTRDFIQRMYKLEQKTSRIQRNKDGWDVTSWAGAAFTRVLHRYFNFYLTGCVHFTLLCTVTSNTLWFIQPHMLIWWHFTHFFSFIKEWFFLKMFPISKNFPTRMSFWVLGILCWLYWHTAAGLSILKTRNQWKSVRPVSGICIFNPRVCID